MLYYVEKSNNKININWFWILQKLENNQIQFKFFCVAPDKISPRI